MACKQYFVVLHEDQWNVRFEDEHQGPYPSLSKAIRAAIDAAHLIGSKGKTPRFSCRTTLCGSERNGPTGKIPTRPRTELKLLVVQSSVVDFDAIATGLASLRLCLGLFR